MQSSIENSQFSFKDKNTLFVGIVKKPPSNSQNSTNNVKSPKNQKKMFNDNYNYSCFGNTRSQSIYLNEKTFSGKLLNSQLIMKENVNNKYLFSETSQLFPFDLVYNGNLK